MIILLNLIITIIKYYLYKMDINNNNNNINIDDNDLIIQKS